jgi:Zn-dependent protease with chaperone function
LSNEVALTPQGTLAVTARYYPASGAAHARDAVLRVGDHLGDLALTVASESTKHFKVTEIVASERFSRATRTVHLPDGAVLEVDDGEQLSRVLAAAGQPDAIVTRWQHSWRVVITSLVLAVVILVAAYVWVLPVAADFAARRVPASWTEALDSVVIRQLKLQGSLQPSELPTTDQARLRAKFDAVIAASSGVESAPKINIYFYRMGEMPNAFALPGGSIVFLDGIVKAAPDDDALVGVFAHEFGHVKNRHGLRTLLRTAVLSAVAAWYFGDFTTLAGAAVVVSQLRHSRAFETEADDVAIAMMRENRIGTKSLAELFRRMRDRGGLFDHDDEKKEKAGTPDAEKRDNATPSKRDKLGSFSIPEFLSTHPDIEQRIERFEKAIQPAQ